MKLFSFLSKLHLIDLMRKNPKQTIIAVITLAAVFSLMGSSVAYAYSCSGTVDVVDWTGTSYLQWNLVGARISYTGQSFTEADSVIDQIYVRSWGCETCGVVNLSPDWDSTGTLNNDWIVGRSGSGLSNTLGSCLYYWWPHWSVGSYGDHQVWENNDTDSGDSGDWITEDWW